MIREKKKLKTGRELRLDEGGTDDRTLRSFKHIWPHFLLRTINVSVFLSCLSPLSAQLTHVRKPTQEGSTIYWKWRYGCNLTYGMGSRRSFLYRETYYKLVDRPCVATGYNTMHINDLNKWFKLSSRSKLISPLYIWACLEIKRMAGRLSKIQLCGQSLQHSKHFICNQPLSFHNILSFYHCSPIVELPP